MAKHGITTLMGAALLVVVVGCHRPSADAAAAPPDAPAAPMPESPPSPGPPRSDSPPSPGSPRPDAPPSPGSPRSPAALPAPAAPAFDVAALAERPLHTFTESELDAYLPIARRQHPELTDRVVHLARKAIGQPYEIFLLGEFPFETHDPDPLYCLGRSDCLTFCEHIYAMALADDWWSFLRNLQRIRYAGGAIGMLTRNHYTEADWNVNNAWLLEDITARLGGGQAAVPFEQVVRRAKFFAKFGVGQNIADQTWRDQYIPTAAVPAILGELRNGDFVNIMRGDKAAPFCGHTGLIAIGDDGTVNFLHSARPQVREEPLTGYLARNRSRGIKILRLRPDAETRMRAALAADEATKLDAAALRRALAEWPVFADHAPPSYAHDWKAAMRLQAYRLDHDTPVDGDLQAALERADAAACAELGIAPDQRAIGVLDLSDLRLAAIEPDRIFYGASVPKICILLAWFAQDPSRAERLDPATRRELELMIKRSDNELAAKYSQLVGLDEIQKLLQSPAYRFYDAQRGGGLWCGKHYGIAEPRIGEPVADHSHAVTVRQCLRYYLMLEQGRLVSPQVCATIKQIFAAPELDFHNDNFVKGLNGRDVTILRKNGEWEDWHLDTARVQNGARVYLLAGATHHPQGREYLSRMAAAIDEALCGPARRPPPWHELVIHEAGGVAQPPSAVREPAALGRVAQPPSAVREPAAHGRVAQPPSAVREPAAHGRVAQPPSAVREPAALGRVAQPPSAVREPAALGRLASTIGNMTAQQSVAPIAPAAAIHESEIIEPAGFFNEVVLSWNIHTPPGGVFAVELRVGRKHDDFWSPWLYVGDWGAIERPADAVTRFDGGRIDVDYFRSDERYDRLQYRIRLAGGDARIERVAVCTSDLSGIPLSGPRPGADRDDASPAAHAAPGRAPGRLPVPFRSQKVERREIAGRICSPTSVAMVLAYYGVELPTERVAEACWDPTHEIYGNWPRNVQAAFSLGVPGYLTRLADWAAVERMVGAGIPLIISIRFSEPGALRGAPYKTTDGHLLVLCGFDAEGNVQVNDPAAPTAERGMISYTRTDLERVWFGATGGLAYVLLPPAGPSAARVGGTTVNAHQPRR